MIFGKDAYEDAVARSHRTHRSDEYLVWRSPRSNVSLRWIATCAILTVCVIVSALLNFPNNILGVWMIALMYAGIWRLFTPVIKLHLGYSVTSKRIVVFRLITPVFLDRQTTYDLSNFHPPIVERNVIVRSYGDLRFDRASSKPDSWRNTWVVRALSLLFESVRIRDVKNPDVVAELIRQDKTIAWGATQ